MPIRNPRTEVANQQTQRRFAPLHPRPRKVYVWASHGIQVILAGLLPIMFGEATGSEIMQRIAAPMVGGMITAPLLSMLVIPVAYALLRGRPFVRVGMRALHAASK